MTEVYLDGHHDSVLRSHRWRTAENPAAYLLAHLRLDARVLDVGCGPGTITADLAPGCPAWRPDRDLPDPSGLRFATVRIDTAGAVTRDAVDRLGRADFQSAKFLHEISCRVRSVVPRDLSGWPMFDSDTTSR